MKKISFIIMLTVVFSVLCMPIKAKNATYYEAEYSLLTGDDVSVSADSAILIDAATGEVLYMKNPDEALPPASVTKVMTLLLVSEAIADGRIKEDELVTISEYASSMGGSQVFLKEGERLSVSELLKCTVIASANDAAVALAEHVAGSESTFVSRMNEKAKELNLRGSSFENVTGLDDTTEKHLMSARDIAIISKELIKYPHITEYASIWQDTIRNGEFTLTNTNRLVRYYDGCNGLKTGSTDKAGFCISATAKRGELQLIAVIMGAPTRDERNRDARTLLDFGFANYALYDAPCTEIEKIPVHFGKSASVPLYKEAFKKVVRKSDLKSVEAIYEIPEALRAPIKKGDSVGKVTYKIGDSVIGESDLYIDENIEKLGFFDIFLSLIRRIIVG